MKKQTEKWRREKNPVILHLLIESLQSEVFHLQKVNKELEEKRTAELQELLKLDDQYLKLKKRMFAKSSEKISTRKRDKKENELLVHAQSLVPPPTDEEVESLEEIEVTHELTKEELAQIAKEYGYPEDSEWELINGFYDESVEVDVAPKKYRKKRHKRFKYRLKASKNTEKEIIVTAPGPLKVVNGSGYSIEFALEVVADKYIYHMPFERQCREMGALGLKSNPKQLYNLSLFVSQHLEKMNQSIKEEILGCNLSVHLDETGWPITNKKQSDGYLWVLSNQAGSYYQFEPTRSGKIAKELLGSYVGPVLVDGFSGYDRLKDNEKLVIAHCWAHVRREFRDIESNYPKECKEILRLISKLFKVEKRSRTIKKLKENRDKQSRLLVEDIKKWLCDNKIKSRPESGLRKAINYTMNHWDGLTKFLENERIPLTNNEVERTIRHAVVGRKNAYGSQTINGADVLATLYTVIESAKKVQLDPKEFIKMAVTMSARGDTPPTPLQYATQLRKG